MANNDISTTNYSIKKLVANIQDFTNDHGVIKSFGVGNASQIGAVTVNQYPLLWLDYLPIQFTENSIKYAFQVIAADLINPSETYPGESDLLNRRADTIAFLWDLIQALEYTYDYDINFNGTLTPFQDTKVDKISGYYMNLEIKVPMVYTICDIPAKNSNLNTLFLIDFDSAMLTDSDNSDLITA